MPHLPLLRMLEGYNQLSRLRELKLANCRMEEDQLVGALLLCASTLNTLSLDDVILDRGTWESAIERLQGQVICLTNFHIKEHLLYGMGPEMEVLVRSYGIRNKWAAFGYYHGSLYELSVWRPMRR